MESKDKKEIQEKMAIALEIAKGAWEDAEMPPIYANAVEPEVGKIALAIIAAKILELFETYF